MGLLFAILCIVVISSWVAAAVGLKNHGVSSPGRLGLLVLFSLALFIAFSFVGWLVYFPIQEHFEAQMRELYPHAMLGLESLDWAFNIVFLCLAIPLSYTFTEMIAPRYNFSLGQRSLLTLVIFVLISILFYILSSSWNIVELFWPKERMAQISRNEFFSVVLLNAAISVIYSLSMNTFARQLR